MPANHKPTSLPVRVVLGRVVVKESGQGVAGLVVAVYAELDAPGASWRWRLGSVITDRSGAFTLEYEPIVGVRASWHLALTVSAPDDCASDSRKSGPPLTTCTRSDPAHSESFHIRITAEKLAAYAILPEPNELFGPIAVEMATISMAEDRQTVYSVMAP